MTDDRYAYSTTDPGALAAYDAALAAREEYAARLRVAAIALGGGDRGRSGIKGFGGPEELIGLHPDGSGTVPHGWVIIRDILKPATRGEGSAAAMRWMREHQPGPEIDPIYALKEHGLAYQSRVWTHPGSFSTYLPILLKRDGELWAGYHGQPEGDFPGDPANITWTPRTITEFETAQSSDLSAAA